MEFVGQSRIVEELKLIAISCREGNNYNLLLSAPSGFGKTTLALLFLNAKGLVFSSIGNPPTFAVDLSKRYIFLDEIHQLKEPEVLYNRLDSGTNTFILATNETGILKEPLINRCIVLEFDDYTDREAAIIMNNIMGFELPEPIIEVLIRVTSKVPRQMKMLCTRLKYIFSVHGVPDSSEILLDLIYNILNLDENGYNAMQRRYLNYLDSVGGSASITTIANGLRIPKATLLREVEPRLLYDQKLMISSKGRTLT